jgi:hypothetical protein
MVAHSALGLVELQNGQESEEDLHMAQQQKQRNSVLDVDDYITSNSSGTSISYCC